MRKMSLTEGTKLARINPLPSISIYLKADQKDRGNQESMSERVKKLLKRLEVTVRQKYGQSTSEKMIRPLQKAIGNLKVENNYAGLAIYHNAEVTAKIDLPSHVEDFAVASDSFHLKPVLRLAQTHRPHLLLAFRASSARLYQVTTEEVKTLEKIDLSEVASDLKPLSRGNGGGTLNKNYMMNSALVEIDKRLRKFVTKERLPLVLAGDRTLVESFKRLCKYSNILDFTLEQNLEFIDERSIGKCSMNLVEKYFEVVSEQKVQTYMKSKSMSLTSSDLFEIAEVAVQGQVQHLFVAEDQHLWGNYDRSTGVVEVVSHTHTGAQDDVYDDIAELVILKGGSVTVLPTFQMPEGLPIAATFRWVNNVKPMWNLKAISSYVSSPSVAPLSAKG